MRFLLLAALALLLCFIGANTASAQYPGERIVAINGVPLRSCANGQCGYRTPVRNVIRVVRPGVVVPKPVPDPIPNMRPIRLFWFR